MKDFPTKRDFWYCFIISILLCIFVIVFNANNPSKVNSEIGFGCTLLSIALSLVAIIYTLIDSSNNKITSAKIINSASTIEDVTQKVDESSNQLMETVNRLSKMDIENRFDVLLEKLNMVKGEVATTLDEKLNLVTSDIFKNNENQSSLNNDIQIHFKETLRYLISNLKDEYYHTKEIIYCIYQIKILDKPLSSTMDGYLKNNYKESMYGRLITVTGFFNYLNLFRFNKETKRITTFDTLLDETAIEFENTNPELAEKIKSYFNGLEEV